jgi:hypothetical protein
VRMHRDGEGACHPRTSALQLTLRTRSCAPAHASPPPPARRPGRSLTLVGRPTGAGRQGGPVQSFGSELASLLLSGRRTRTSDPHPNRRAVDGTTRTTLGARARARARARRTTR